jgi:hypothetical protein
MREITAGPTHYGPGNEKMLDSIRNIQQVVLTQT